MTDPKDEYSQPMIQSGTGDVFQGFTLRMISVGSSRLLRLIMPQRLRTRKLAIRSIISTKVLRLRMSMVVRIGRRLSKKHLLLKDMRICFHPLN